MNVELRKMEYTFNWEKQSQHRTQNTMFLCAFWFYVNWRRIWGFDLHSLCLRKCVTRWPQSISHTLMSFCMPSESSLCMGSSWKSCSQRMFWERRKCFKVGMQVTNKYEMLFSSPVNKVKKWWDCFKYL